MLNLLINERRSEVPLDISVEHGFEMLELRLIQKAEDGHQHVEDEAAVLSRVSVLGAEEREQRVEDVLEELHQFFVA